MSRLLKVMTLAGAVGGAVWYAVKRANQPAPVEGTWQGKRHLQPVPAPEPAPPTGAEIDSEPTPAESAAEIRESDVATTPPSPTETDLTAIRGIGEVRAQELRAIGISTLGELAAADPNELSAKLDGRDVTDWIDQARRLTE